MPARDRHHNAVRHALEADGWTITDDPLTLRIGSRDLYVDLGAQRLLAAERGQEKIAVEIKVLSGLSPVANLEQAIGQFVLYSDALETLGSDRVLYLALPNSAMDILDEPIGMMILRKKRLRIVVFDAREERILSWYPENV
jgi:hypothetical protein